MIRKYRAVAFVIAAVSIACFALPGARQGLAFDHGWSQIQTLKHGQKPATLNALYYGGDEVWIVGGNGLIVRSSDGGSSFKPVDSPVDSGLNDVLLDAKRIWIVGDAGTIIRSTDGGRSFTKTAFTAYHDGQSIRLDLYSVQFLDKKVGYIVGDQGLILNSTDGGGTWQPVASGSPA